jgi:hypothetical protein
MSCSVSFQRVVDWWLDDLSDVDRDAFEIHLFECDECATRARELGGIASALDIIIKERKSHPLVIAEADLEQWTRTKRVGIAYAKDGDVIQGMSTPEGDLLALRVAADLRGISRVTVQLLGPDDSVVVEVPNAPFSEKEIIIACTRGVAAISPELRLRILGDDRVIARLRVVN